MKTIGFVLSDGFPMLGFAGLIDTFHVAAGQPGFPDYRLRTLAIGDPAVPAGGVRAANGVMVQVDGSIGDDAMTHDLDIAFLISPRNRTGADGRPDLRAMIAGENEALLAPLRTLAARGVTIGGVAGGAWLIAQAGLLDGYTAAIHRDLQGAFAEAFPNVALERDASFVIDRDRLTARGGVDAMKLATKLVLLAERIRGRKVDPKRTSAMLAQTAPTESLRQRHDTANPTVLRALVAMEAHISETLSRAVLAKAAGVSVRQLERLFREHLYRTIDEVYRRIRLEHAVTLLRETSMTAKAIAAACGFKSAGAFSRAFSRRYGVPPAGARKYPFIRAE